MASFSHQVYLYPLYTDASASVGVALQDLNGACAPKPPIATSPSPVTSRCVLLFLICLLRLPPAPFQSAVLNRQFRIVRTLTT